VTDDVDDEVEEPGDGRLRDPADDHDEVVVGIDKNVMSARRVSPHPATM
jgi:hypothetical protein